jgi:predicted PolB exonuclease-like 3'-5' exonuclease
MNNSENKKKIAAYDIETIARPLPDEIVNEFCKIGNLKDPIKIAAKQAEARSKLGANPLMAMACCGGWYASDEDCGYVMLSNEGTAFAEQAFLRNYWSKLAEYDVLVGFNCFSFDSRILLLRSAVHNIEIPFRLDRKKYSSSGNHIDVRGVLTDWGTFEAGKLDFFLSMFGLEGKTKGIAGNMVQDYWNEGLHDEIGKYCEQDCKQTFQLFQKIKQYFL